jgi:pyroglutamyl-peptidase
MPQKPLLITGFKPWGDRGSNITQQILEDLRPDLESRGIEIAVLDVLYDAVDEFIASLKTRDYFNVISLGIMRQSAPPIRFETIARKTAFKPDDSGKCPVFNEAAAEYNGAPSLLALRNHEKLCAYDIGLSDQAGSYLCEYIYYRMLENVTPKGNGAGVFIHMSNDDFAGKRQFLLDYLDALDSKNIQEPS